MGKLKEFKARWWQAETGPSSCLCGRSCIARRGPWPERGRKDQLSKWKRHGQGRPIRLTNEEFVPGNKLGQQEMLSHFTSKRCRRRCSSSSSSRTLAQGVQMPSLFGNQEKEALVRTESLLGRIPVKFFRSRKILHGWMLHWDSSGAQGRSGPARRNVQAFQGSQRGSLPPSPFQRICRCRKVVVKFPS